MKRTKFADSRFLTQTLVRVKNRLTANLVLFIPCGPSLSTSNNHFHIDIKWPLRFVCNKTICSILSSFIIHTILAKNIAASAVNSGWAEHRCRLRPLLWRHWKGAGHRDKLRPFSWRHENTGLWLVEFTEKLKIWREWQEFRILPSYWSISKILACDWSIRTDAM